MLQKKFWFVFDADGVVRFYSQKEKQEPVLVAELREETGSLKSHAKETEK